MNDNFIYEVPKTDVEKIERLDKIDNTIWTILHSLNEELSIGVNFKEIEHTHLNIEARDSLIEVLESFK